MILIECALKQLIIKIKRKNNMFFCFWEASDLQAPIKSNRLSNLTRQFPHLPFCSTVVLVSVEKDQTCVWWWLPKELQLMACHLSLEPLKGGTRESMMQTKARFRTSILKAPIDSAFWRPASKAFAPAGPEPCCLSWGIRGICRN